MKTCASCPSPAKCKAAGKCLKSSAKMGYGGMPKKAKKAYGGLTTKAGKTSGGMAKKAKMNKGGMTKANCGASMKPTQSSTPKGK